MHVLRLGNPNKKREAIGLSDGPNAPKSPLQELGAMFSSQFK